MHFGILSWLALAAIITTLALDASPVGVVVALFVIVVPFEKLFPRHRQRLRRPGLGTDIAHALVAGPLAVVGLVAGIVIGTLSLVWLPALALRPVVAAVPALPRALLGVLLFDLAIYWVHRFSHEVPFLWRFHSIHHSTERLDWVSGFRGHPLDGALLAPAFVLLIAAGFSPELGGALVVVQIVTGLFLHANVRWRWRPLHRVVITPEFHHWHHANEPDAYNSNYSVFLPVWDLVFDTYFMPCGRRPQVYGVSEAVPPGIIAQLWHPMRGLRNPLRMLRHPRRSIGELRRMLARGTRQLIASARRQRMTTA